MPNQCITTRAGLASVEQYPVLLIFACFSTNSHPNGLRLLLKMMRSPARAAGLDALQSFLGRGFDVFIELTRTHGALEFLLKQIHLRESLLIEELFRPDLVACETFLRQSLGQAR